MPRRTLYLLAAVTTALVASIGAAVAAPVDEVEGNDSLATAQNIDAYFTLDADPNIYDSTTVPHASVIGTGNNTFDVYSFTVPEAGVGTVGLMDIDGGMYSFDPWLNLYDSDGALLSQVDDCCADPGSAHHFDPLLSIAFPEPGTYYVLVGQYCCPSPIPDGATYVLHVSVPGHQNDSTAPELTLPADMTVEATGSDGAVVDYTTSALDETDGTVAVECSPASGSRFPLGTTQVTCSASDAADNVATGAFDVSVRYGFDGFAAPINNGGVFNTVKAGRAIPAKFGLSGDMGLGIFAAGSPASQAISCDSSAPQDAIEQTLTAGGSSLTYDPALDSYTYVWKTASSWAGSCRLLTLTLADGSQQTAKFKFTR